MTSNPEPNVRDGQSESHISTGRRRTWTALGAAAVAGIGGLTAWHSPAVRTRPRVMARTTGIPDVPLVTHEGRKVRFYSDLIRDKVVFVSMMYTQCSEQCPLMTQNLRRVHEAIGSRAGRDVFFYSITLLPEFDRPAELKAYRDLNHIGPGWTFLTGTKADVEQIRMGMGFFDPDPAVDADISEHTGMVRVGNDRLQRWLMAPLLQDPPLILEALMAVDPVSRAAGRESFGSTALL
jgi:protein SCO1/2